MDLTQKFTIILFKLPDGKIILQRRTKDAPYGAGLLGIFGGWVEEGESAEECLMREIKEETSLDINSLKIKFIKDFVMPASKDFDKDRHFYLYEGQVNSLDFEVFEGDGAEALSPSDVKERDDLTTSAKYVFEYIYKVSA